MKSVNMKENSEHHIELDFSIETETRLKACEFWWNKIDNYKGTPVRSCRHAITYRDRLGSGEHGGVPLWCELKSQLGAVKTETGELLSFFAAHSRANTEFDIEAISRYFESNHKKITIDFLIDEDEMIESNESQSDSLYFGLVNPVIVDKILEHKGFVIRPIDVVQLFDTSVTQPGGHPDTIITNLGIRTKGMEISPKDLIHCVMKIFPNTTVYRIAKPDHIWLGKGGKFVKDEWLRFPPPYGPKIGILTGNSPESGLALWQDILISYRKLYRNLTDVLMPEIVVHSLPEMGLSMELVEREEHVWEAINKAIVGLLEAGCKLITLACNTTIYFEEEIENLCRPYQAKFISIAEACIPAIKNALDATNSKTKGVGLVGIGPVIDMAGGYSGYKKHFLDNSIKVTPCSGEKLAYIMKNIGTDKDDIKSAIAKFRNMIQQQLPTVDVVVLSLTEISLVYRGHIDTMKKGQQSRKTFIDPLYELARYLVFLYLSFGFKISDVCQIPEIFNLDQKLIRHVYRDSTIENIGDNCG